MPEQIQGFRLSPQQRHLWRLQAESRAYRSQCALALTGELDAAALRQALAAAVARHEALHTGFRRAPGVRFPLQVPLQVPEAGALPLWQSVDLTGRGEEERQQAVAELLRQAARRPFDLERGPQVHAWLAALAPDRHLLVLGAPALCADRAGLRILVRDLLAAYAGAPAGEEPVQYAQFAEWQNELLEGEESLSGRDFWRRQEGAAALAWKLPLEAPPALGGFAPERLEVPLSPALAGRLREVAAGLDVPAAAVLLAAWQVLLARLTGEPRPGIGLLLDGRQQEGLEETVGLFARCLPLPAPAALDDPFAGWAQATAAAWTEAADWQVCHAPEEGERAAAGFPACFERVRRAPAPAGARGLEVALLREDSWTERFRVCLRAVEEGDDLSLELDHDARTISSEPARALAGRYLLLLEALLASPERSAAEAELLTPEERRRLLRDLNATAAPYPGDRPLHRLIAEQAARTPAAVAVDAGTERLTRLTRLTYSELTARARRLARSLAVRGVGPGVIVGLCMERSVEMVVGVLGVLEAGAAYLPMDSAYPRERLAFLAADAGVRLVLTQDRLADRLPETVEAVPLDLLETEWDSAGLPAEAPPLPLAASPEDLAYVIYTSGSTGAPKGVMVPHRAVVNYLTWAAGAYRTGDGWEGRGAPLHSPLGFDLTVTSLFLPLLGGGTVLLTPEDRGVDALAGQLRREGSLSLLKVTPAHLALLGQALADADLAGRVGTLVVGGEALLGEHLAPWRERLGGTRVVNEYGPTEATVGCCVFQVPPAGELAGPVPIGRPIANTRLHLLDGALRPVPEGVPGELFLGGDGLARGYLGRPGLTAERFVPDPFAGRDTPAAPGSRLYRTGDLARLLPGGDLEFLGRTDHQVKIRGVRVEPGEIEAVLAGHPGVGEAAVAVREDTPGDRRLVAYFAARQEPAPNVDELRRFLAERLPEAMVPAVFVPLAALPLTRNGKLDRAALPAPSSQRPDLEREYVAPRTPLEETLAGLWIEVLGIDRVGVLDSFFALGGDSIRSVRVVALAKEKGIDITVEDLFRHQTVAALAAAAAGVGAAAGGGAVAAPTPPTEPTEDDLARLVAELEGLSDEEAAIRLREVAALEEE